MSQKKIKKRKFNGRILLLLTIIISVFLLFGFSNYIYSAMLRPVGTSTEEVIVDIPKGSTIKEVSKILLDHKLIKNSMIFESYAGRHSRGYKQIQAATYSFNQKMTSQKIFDMLINGEVAKDATEDIIPEGKNLKEIAAILEANRVCSAQSFIDEASKVDYYKQTHPILASIPSGTGRTLEGYLFPDTYHFLVNTEATEVVHTMVKRFEQKMSPYITEIQNSGKTVDQIVIMGSIVELETKLPEDRTNAASVFYNRMNEQMPLQSDITIDYARGYKTPILTEEETKFESPYNTYIHLGLPFGPICSPGESSIQAALHPAATKYLYFVADMNSGKLYFNETLAGHDADVAKYLGN